MHRQVSWDGPNYISGSMSAYFDGGYLTIDPVEVNPKK
jgi:hypothetical protein